MLDLGRERVRRRIFGPPRGVGSVMVLGLAVSTSEGRVVDVGRGSGSIEFGSFLWSGGMVGWFNALHSSLSI